MTKRVWIGIAMAVLALGASSAKAGSAQELRARMCATWRADEAYLKAESKTRKLRPAEVETLSELRSVIASRCEAYGM